MTVLNGLSKNVVLAPKSAIHSLINTTRILLIIKRQYTVPNKINQFLFANTWAENTPLIFQPTLIKARLGSKQHSYIQILYSIVYLMFVFTCSAHWSCHQHLALHTWRWRLASPPALGEKSIAVSSHELFCIIIFITHIWICGYILKLM